MDIVENYSFLAFIEVIDHCNRISRTWFSGCDKNIDEKSLRFRKNFGFDYFMATGPNNLGTKCL